MEDTSKNTDKEAAEQAAVAATEEVAETATDTTATEEAALTAAETQVEEADAKTDADQSVSDKGKKKNKKKDKKKDKTKGKKKGNKIAVISIISVLLALILAVSLFFGISSCSPRSIVTPPKEGATTVRKELPTDGSLPTDHSGLENIGYMATVLDGQSFYHAYANNSTKSTGYEQVTQTWKDYKVIDVNGVSQGVMVCSDLSYSALVKASTQSCFIGSETAYMRGGNKPSKNSTPSDIVWAKDQPSYYDKETYLTAYGEFSTELSVYAINEDSFIDADAVIDNGGGTYSQKFYLNSEAACWYQYGMKTRGGLKTLPEFEKIEITFTFDKDWRVLSSYCEEKSKIAPGALGGMSMGSASKTTTTFDYSEAGFDNTNFGNFENYFKNYVGTTIGPNQPGGEEVSVIEILGNAFSKVVDPNGNGQQFNLELTLGETEYVGKAYAKVSDMGDILGSLDVRIALEKKASGKQDLYIQFANGALDVYYSDGFAMTANLNEVIDAVGKISDWVNAFDGKIEAQDIAYALTGDAEEGSSLDFNSLINSLKCTQTDTTANISLISDDLLGLGIGIDFQINCDRTIDESGSTYSFKNLSIGSVTYNSTPVDLGVALAPDSSSETVSRDKVSACANLADYLNAVLGLLDSKTYKVQIGFDGLIEGLTADATAYVNIKGEISTDVEINAEYNGITLSLNAYYVYDGGYGKVYLTLTEFNGNSYNAKIYCDVQDTVDTVKMLLDWANGSQPSALSEEQASQASDGLADIINKILGLDFARIITDLKGDDNSLSLSVNADEILSAFNVDLGMQLGEIKLTLNRNNGKATLDGSLEKLGITLGISGSENIISKPDGEYVDIVEYINSVYALLNSETLKVQISLDETLLEGLGLNATAYVKISDELATKVSVEAEYKQVNVALDAYYVYDGGYGKLYLNLTQFNGNEYDAKVYCDIKDAVDGVKQLISLFNTNTNGTTLTEEEENTLGDIITYVLSLNYNEILRADNNSLKVTVNVDEILNDIGVDLGMEIGTVTLEYALASSSLTGNVPALGLGLEVSGSENVISVPDGEYVDIVEYINSVYALLNSETLKVQISLDETLLEGLGLNATAYVKVSDELATKVSVEAEYKQVNIALDAYYVYDGGYGKLYLNLTQFNGNEYDAKVYCDIKDAVDGVKQLISLFNANTNGATLTEEEEDTLGDIITYVLSLNYNEILRADNNSLKVTVNVDEILNNFGVDLGMEIGTVTLEYALASSSLTGNVPALGLGLEVSGSENTISTPDGEYVDIVEYINSVYELINGRKYQVNLTVDGVNCDKLSISYLNGVYANLQAQVQLSQDFKTIGVAAPITVSYEEITLKLTAYYTVNLSSGTYGEVYLNVTQFNGNEYDAKVYCDIKDAASSVTKLIELFSNKKDGEAKSEAKTAVTVAQVIDLILNLDYNEIISADNNSLKLNINLDDVLGKLDIDAGVQFGELALTLNVNGGKATLDGSLEKLGLTLGISGLDGEIETPNGEYVDIVEYIDSVYGLINGRKYQVNLTVDGVNSDKLSISYLNGVYANLQAQVQLSEDFKTICVTAPITVSYETLSIKLTAYYTVNLSSGTYGTVYVNLIELCNQAFDAKMYCDINEMQSAVRDLIILFTNSAMPANESEVSEGAAITSAKVIEALLCIDYSKVIKADNSSLTVTVDADEVLGEFIKGTDLEGLKLGTVTLIYNKESENSPAGFTGSVPALGLSLGVTAGDEQDKIGEPADKGNYLDAAELADIIGKATNQVKGIIESQDAALCIEETSVIIDGVKTTVSGKGEVSWKNGEIVVALNLGLTVNDGGETKSVNLNFIYDGAATEVNGEEQPLVLLTLNNTGLDIKRSEIDNLTATFGDLITAIKNIIGEEDDGSDSFANPDNGTYSLSGENTNGAFDFIEILKNENVNKAISAVLGFIGDFTVKIETIVADGEDISNAVTNLILGYSDKATLTIGADDGLRINLKVGENAKVGAAVEAGNGATVTEIRENLAKAEADEAYTFYDIDGFVRAMYDYIFDVIDNVLSLEEVLGTDAYAVKVHLIGANSKIEAIENIDIDATLYYAEGLTGDKIGTKIIRTDLTLDISGTAVQASLIYSGQNLFVELTKIGNTVFGDLKFKASVHDLYEAVDTLIRIITDTDLAVLIKGFGKNAALGGGADVEEAEQNLATLSENDATNETLKNVLNVVLSLELNKSFKFDKRNHSAEINVDEILNAAFGVKIGTVKVNADPDKKHVSASVTVEGSEAWIEINAAPATEDVKDKNNALDPDKYMDIGFVSTLLSDLTNTITDSGKNVYTLYTYTGKITANIIAVGDVQMEKATLTVGLDENGEFYFSLAAALQSKNFLWYTVANAMDISVTYYNGYITFGRNIGTNEEAYKVMTLDYLLDHMLKNDSPLRWLLGTSESAWNMVMNGLSGSVNISSGLTTPQDYKLYEQQQIITDGAFNLSDYLTGIKVVTDGKDASQFGNGASEAVKNFNLSDNYYAFDIEAEKLTGNVLTKLCAALIRSEEGISGIKAYGAIQNYISFTLDFDTYRKGVTEIYGGKVLQETEVTEDSFYNDFAVFEGSEFEDGVTYYVYDEQTEEKFVAVPEDYSREEGVTYFVKVNTIYHLADGTLAESYDENATYYIYSDSTASLGGNVAAPNYYKYVKKNYAQFDPERKFEAASGSHYTPVFGCFSTEGNNYDTSNVLEIVYLDIYSSVGRQVKDKTVELKYGSTVHLISDFPEFTDESNTYKLIYLDADGKELANSIVLEEGKIAGMYTDADGKLRISIYKSSEQAVAVTFDFGGVGGMKPVMAAFGEDDMLVGYPLGSNYTFIGWYNNADFTDKAESVDQITNTVNGVKTVYGKYVQTEVMINGVKYAFDSQSGNYFVKAFDKAFISEFTQVNSVLVLENYISNGDIKYPVTSIGEGAFDGAGLKNVVVPENITSVGKSAFKDNYGIRTVVFLADSVYLAGGEMSGVVVFGSPTNDGPFYGCSEQPDGTTTLLNVYYNKITCDSGKNWRHIRRVQGWGVTHYLIGDDNCGGSRHSAIEGLGYKWAYVNYSFDVNGVTDYKLSELGLVSGLFVNDGKVAFTDDESLIAYLENALDNLTKADENVNATNVYTVDITGGSLSFNGKMNNIIINIIKNPESEWIYPVEVKFTVDGEVVNTQNLNKGDALYNYEIAGKSLIGWYADESFTHKLDVFDGQTQNLYGRYLNNTEVINGVVYSLVNGEHFVVDNSIPALKGVYGYHYEVTGTTDEISNFSSKDSYLTLENEFGGLPVTTVAKNALASTGIKNVVVPENITRIEVQAFRNNKDMQSAVFLANVVYMGGTGFSENNYYPFYGCSVTGNDQLTQLNLYYNVVVSDRSDFATSNPGDTAWMGFYHENGSLFSKEVNCWVGDNGGSRNGWRVDYQSNQISESNKNWTYVQYVLAGDAAGFSAEQLGLSNYVSRDGVLNLSQTEKDVKAKLDAFTANMGYINAYDVVASVEETTAYIRQDETKVVKQIVTVNLTYQKDSAWHKLQLSDNDTAVNVVLSENENIVKADGENCYFVKPQTVIVLRISATSHVFDKVCVTVNKVSEQPDVIVEEKSEYAYTMTADVTTIEVEFRQATIEEVKLISAVSVEGFVSEGDIFTQTVNEFDLTSTLTADDYTFLGWAYAVGDLYEFANENSLSQSVYYALWAHEREGVTYSVIGTTITASVDGGNAQEVDGWYADGDDNFETELEGGTAYNFGSLNSATVIKTRLSYSLTVNFVETTNTIWGYNKSDGYAVNEVESSGRTSTATVKISKGTAIGNNNYSFENVVKVLEGYTVAVYRYYSDGITIRLFNSDGIAEENCVGSYLIKGFVTNGSSVSNPKKGSGRAIAGGENNYISFGDGVWNIDGAVTNKDGKCYKPYADGENNQLIATVNNVNGKLSFSAKA